MRKTNNSERTPKGRLVEVDGIQYLLIDGKLYRYADLTMDKGFKIVLGCPGSEEVLRHMLNSLLGLRIVNLEYRNTEHPGMTEEDRESRFDVYCEDEDGHGFQVEMQNWSQKFFNKRAVYYSSLVLQDQAVREITRQKKSRPGKWKWDYNFKPLYVVSFLNFRNWTSANERKKINDYISIYRYKDIETNEELGDGTNIIFVDLFSFQKQVDECENMLDNWMFSLKNMFTLYDCPAAMKGTEIEELFQRSELAGMSVTQRIKYEESVMTENDIRNSIAEQLEEAEVLARKVGHAEGLAKGRAEGLAEGRAEGLAEGRAEGLAEGREEGHAEGREEGREEGKAMIIRCMYSNGISAEEISKMLNMTLEEVNSIL